MDDHKQRLQSRLERAREFLLTSIEGAGEQTLTVTTVCGDWTIKDVLGHIVSWGDELRSEIGEILIDSAPRYGYVISSDRDYEEWNRSQAAQKEAYSLREIVAELDRDCAETVDLINRLDPDDLQRHGVVPWNIEGLTAPEDVGPGTSMSVVALLEIHIQHIEEHAEELGRWRSEKRKRVKVSSKTMARVIADYEAPYADPIAVNEGDEVEIDSSKTTDWAGWVWCTNGAGKSGWVPESYIERRGDTGAMRCDYNAIELTVRVGELLSVHKAKSGFFWATNERGQDGWVPSTHVELVTG